MNHKIKVLQVCNNIEVRFGGPSAVVTGIQGAFERKFDHQLVVFGKIDQILPKVIQVKTVRNNHYGFFWGAIPARIREFIKAADIILIHQIYAYSTLLILLSAKKKKIIFMPHGTFEIYQQNKSRIRKYVFDAILEFLARNCEISYIVATESEQFGVISKFPSRQVSTVGIGVDVPVTIHPKKVSNSSLLCLSRITEKKRIDICLGALSHLNLDSDNSYVLNIAGQGDELLKSKLIKLAETLKVSSEVNFLGLLVGNEKWKAINDASILLLPSMNENFAISVAECISVGVPVVVSKNVALHTFVKKFNCGIVINELTDKEVSSAVKIIEKNYKNYVNNCISASEYLSWNSVTPKWIDVLESKIAQ